MKSFVRTISIALGIYSWACPSWARTVIPHFPACPGTGNRWWGVVLTDANHSNIDVWAKSFQITAGGVVFSCPGVNGGKDYNYFALAPVTYLYVYPVQ